MQFLLKPRIVIHFATNFLRRKKPIKKNEDSIKPVIEMADLRKSSNKILLIKENAAIQIEINKI